MKLYIAEKPSLGRAIAGALGSGKKKEQAIEGDGWVVTWCFGHLLETAKPEDYNADWKRWDKSHLPIIPERWELKASKDKKKQLKIIKSYLDKASVVINAGDPGREGQLLVDEVMERFNWKGETLRLWAKDLTNSGLKKSLANCKPNSEYQGLKLSAETRQRADWLFGLNMTRWFTVLAREKGYDSVLSVGRVQTPTLAMIVARDREIENFEPKDYHVLKATFSNNGKRYEGVYLPDDNLLVDGRLTNRPVAQAVLDKIYDPLEDTKAEIIFLEKKRKTQDAPIPFALSDLQKVCSKKFKMSAKKVLDIGQALYQKHKLTTYPRSDCGYVEESKFADAPQVLDALKGLNSEYIPHIEKADTSKKPKSFNDANVTEHTGIIPTGKSVDLSELTDDELCVFDVICRRYIAQFMPSHKTDETDVITLCEGFKFKSKGKAITDNGWQDIEPVKKTGKELPVLNKSEPTHCVDGEIEDKKTKPPKRFTEGELIDAMTNAARYLEDKKDKEVMRESKGIGTEATRADIIENIKNRACAVLNDSQIISTDKGRSLVDSLPDALTNPLTSVDWERQLSHIEETANVQNQTDFISNLSEWISNLMSTATDINLKGVEVHHCPKCESGVMHKRKGKDGLFFGCSNYPDCKHTMANKAGKPVSATKPAGSGYKCGFKGCEGELVKRKGKKPWFGCSSFPKCEFSTQSKNGKPRVHGGKINAEKQENV